MQRIRFVMVGGFLGAGKTTTLARLARFYQGRGQKVGLVTNDQAQDLVDTTSLRAQGLPVEEVPGACFCCRFDDLVDRVGRLESGQRPDVILAEPVGSCTDLIATVVAPLRDLYGQRFEVTPYPVLFKPSHGLRILRGESGAGFSPKAAYIFKKQLEEADAIVINRLDELGAAELSELTALVPLGAEVAHLKAIGLWEGFFGVANLVSSGTRPELSLPSNCQVKEADVIVNARVALDPALLREHVEATLRAVCQARGATLSVQQTQSFRPGRPTPTHRYAAAR